MATCTTQTAFRTGSGAARNLTRTPHYRFEVFSDPTGVRRFASDAAEAAFRRQALRMCLTISPSVSCRANSSANAFSRARNAGSSSTLRDAARIADWSDRRSPD